MTPIDRDLLRRAAEHLATHSELVRADATLTRPQDPCWQRKWDHQAKLWRLARELREIAK